MKQEAAINAVTLLAEESDSKELRAIALEIMPDWLALFSAKNADYGSGSAFELGIRGQYSDIHRKMIKLKRSMWDGEELGFEDEEEIIQDLIGHLFLTLYMKRMANEVEREHAYSTMSTDEFLDRLIDEYGGPEKAMSISNVLGTDLANRLVARCGMRIKPSFVMDVPIVEKGDRLTVTGPEGVGEYTVAGLKVGDEDRFKFGGEMKLTLHPVATTMAQRLYERFNSGPTCRWIDLDKGEREHWMKVADEVSNNQAAAYQHLVDQARGFSSPAFGESDAEQHGL
jgi:hypothetical protein